MKLVHKNTGNTAALVQHNGHWKDSGREAELADDWNMAAVIYENAVKTNKNNFYAYHRLMLVYRKRKAYAKELKVINAAIAAYEQLYAARLPTRNKKVIEISSKLNKAFGLVNGKGQGLYDPEPLASLKKRRALVQKRII